MRKTSNKWRQGAFLPGKLRRIFDAPDRKLAGLQVNATHKSLVRVTTGYQNAHREPGTRLRQTAGRLPVFFLFPVFFLVSAFFVCGQSQDARPSTGTQLYENADALAEYRAGNFQTAVAICQDEIVRDPSNLESHVVIGWSLIKLGRYEEAEVYARNGRRLNYYDARIIEILGEASYYQGQNAEALAFFEEYIGLVPDGSRIDVVYYYIGEIFIRQGRFRHADISLSTALHYVPLNAVWWTRLGYARERAGESVEALKAYEKALGLDAQLADARRGIDRIRANLTR
jgi:tetratricopeptide (TPR) repeat protein